MAQPKNSVDEDIKVIRARVAKNLRLLRTARRMTQKQMADAIGVHRVSYTQIEQNLRRVALEEAVVLAKQLRVPLSRLTKEPQEQRQSA